MRKSIMMLPLVACATLAALPAMAADIPPPPSAANHCGRDGPVTLYAIAGTHQPPRPPVFGSMEGNVDLNVIVGRDGKPTKVTVIKSDGNWLLENASLATIKNTWRWQPPPPECAEIGVQIQTRVSGSASFHLRILSDDIRYPRAALDRGLGGSGTVNAKVSNAGAVVSATVSESTKSPILDEAMIKAAMTVEFFANPGSPDFTHTVTIPVDFLPGMQRLQEVPDPLSKASGPELPLPSIANECGRRIPVALTPIVSAHAALPYPIESQAAGEQGIVRMKVIVDKSGYVGEATITETSASPRLSDATLDFIKRYWHWAPPPIECQESGVQLNIDQVWTLAPWYLQIYANDSRYPAAVHGKPLGAWGTVRVTVSETGDISDPRIQASAGSAELDASMMNAVMNLPTTPSIKDGKPRSASAVFDVMFMPDSMQNFDTRPIPARPAP